MTIEKRILKVAQDCLSETPAIVVGSGASISCGIPGMDALRRHLEAVIHPDSPSARRCWDSIRKELRKSDLETALLKHPSSGSLLDSIVNATWTFISQADNGLYSRVRADQEALPFSRLFQFLFQSTQRHLSVVTPNYDRMLEYAADAGGWIHYRGFGYGFFPRREGATRSVIHVGGRPARSVNIWKVHGSIDWFQNADGVVFSDPFAREVPPGVAPAIVTPGGSKFEITHNEPFRTIISLADQALSDANAYLCVGFGFNDKHIQPKLVERIKRSSIPLVILARTLTNSARELLRREQCRNYLALESFGTGTKAYTPEKPAGTLIKGAKLWELDEFLGLVTAR